MKTHGKLEELKKAREKTEEQLKNLQAEEDRIKKEEAYELAKESAIKDNREKVKSLIAKKKVEADALIDYYEQLDKKYPGFYQFSEPNITKTNFRATTYFKGKEEVLEVVPVEYPVYKILIKTRPEISISIDRFSKKAGGSSYRPIYKDVLLMVLNGISNTKGYSSIKTVHSKITEYIERSNYQVESRARTKSLYDRAVDKLKDLYPEASIEHKREYVHGNPFNRRSTGYYVDLIEIKFSNGLGVKASARDSADGVSISISSISMGKLDRFEVIGILKDLTPEE